MKSSLDFLKFHLHIAPITPIWVTSILAAIIDVVYVQGNQAALIIAVGVMGVFFYGQFVLMIVELEQLVLCKCAREFLAERISESWMVRLQSIKKFVDVDSKLSIIELSPQDNADDEIDYFAAFPIRPYRFAESRIQPLVLCPRLSKPLPPGFSFCIHHEVGHQQKFGYSHHLQQRHGFWRLVVLYLPLTMLTTTSSIAAVVLTVFVVHFLVECAIDYPEISADHYAFHKVVRDYGMKRAESAYRMSIQPNEISRRLGYRLRNWALEYAKEDHKKDIWYDPILSNIEWAARKIVWVAIFVVSFNSKPVTAFEFLFLASLTIVFGALTAFTVKPNRRMEETSLANRLQGLSVEFNSTTHH